MTSYPSVPLASSLFMEQILGIGRTGVVILQEHIAVKLPLRGSTSRIYLQLEECGGLVQFLGFSETTTRLRLMENGDLCTYLSRHKPPKHLQLSWFREMARSLAYIHDRRIIVVDIASCNLLLDSDLSMKFVISRTNGGGYTVQTDIGQLGAVMYEVLTGQQCDFDIFKDVPQEAAHGSWPRREGLPRTQNVWLGQIIEKCWTRGTFRNAYDSLSEIESAKVENGPPS
ncbi:kinase-like domain-containing protein [Aspergillus californicus]